MTPEEFVAWEKKAGSVDYKPEYVDLAGGDVEAGILLSQILFWNLPSKAGKSKLRVQRDGLLWIAKKRADWWSETRLSPDRIDRAVRILASRGLIKFATFHFNHVPTLHITLLLPEFLRQMDELLDEQNG